MNGSIKNVKKILILCISLVIVICLSSCSNKNLITIDVKKACPVVEGGMSGGGNIWFDCSTENINKSNLKDYEITYIESILNGLEFEVLPTNDYLSMGDEYEVNVVNAEEIYTNENHDIAVQLVNTSYSGIMESIVHDYLNASEIPAEDVDALREDALNKVEPRIGSYIRAKNEDYLLNEITDIEPLDVYYVTSKDTNKLRSLKLYEYVNESGLNERILVYTYKVSFNAHLEVGWSGRHPVYSDETYDDYIYLYCGFRDFTSRFTQRKSYDTGSVFSVEEANTDQEFENLMLNGSTYNGDYGTDDFFVEKWVEKK